jgi:uncharacterized protein (DUF1501 family)
MKRRDFLTKGIQLGVAANALGFMGSAMTPIQAFGRSPLRGALSTASTNENILVLVQLLGGNDGLNCLVPVKDPRYTALRPNLRINRSGIDLKVLPDHDTLAMHDRMAAVFPLYTSRKMAILQNVGYANPELSHFRGADIVHTATDSNIYKHTGWLGRLLSDQNPGFDPTKVVAGSSPLGVNLGSATSNIFLAKSGGMGVPLSHLPDAGNSAAHNYDPIPSNPSTAYQTLDFVRSVQKETEVYSDTISKRAIKTNKVTYPNSEFASNMASVAQMIASGFSTKVYVVTHSGYDHHSNLLAGQAGLLNDLSEALVAFQNDLEAFKVADKVVTMTYSEFGRRPAENGSGTDHGTSYPLFVIGTRVSGGVRGADPDLVNLVNNNLNYDPDHEFRNVYATVLSEWLGISDAEISNVLTSSNGETYSTLTQFKKLGLFWPAGVAPETSQAAGFGLTLGQNYPNPSRGSTTIEFAIPQSTQVELGVWDVAGREIARIVDGTLSAGPHRASLATGSLAEGTYIYRLKTPLSQITKQMTVVR